MSSGRGELEARGGTECRRRAICSLHVAGADDIDQAPGAAPETIVKGQQSAADDLRESDVLRVVCPRPAKIVSDAPRLSVK